MAVRSLHPIVLAGALLAPPAVIAWAPAKATQPIKSIAATPTPEAQPLANQARRVVLPIEIAEHGRAVVQKQIEAQLEPVPEPSSLLLLTASSLLLLRRRRSN